MADTLGDDGVVAVEEVDRLVRAAQRLEARGNDVAAARAFDAARRLWVDLLSRGTPAAAEPDGVRSGIATVRQE